MVTTEKHFVLLAVEPMLIDAPRLAVILSVSVAHIHSLDNQGKLPRPRNLGKSVRWSTQEIREWIAAGCPDRITWMQRGNKE